jgi:hypothetical protein
MAAGSNSSRLSLSLVYRSGETQAGLQSRIADTQLDGEPVGVSEGRFDLERTPGVQILQRGHPMLWRGLFKLRAEAHNQIRGLRFRTRAHCGNGEHRIIREFDAKRPCDVTHFCGELRDQLGSRRILQIFPSWRTGRQRQYHHARPGCELGPFERKNLIARLCPNTAPIDRRNNLYYPVARVAVEFTDINAGVACKCHFAIGEHFAANIGQRAQNAARTERIA